MLRLESVSTRWGLASLASGWEDIRMTIIDIMISLLVSIRECLNPKPFL